MPEDPVARFSCDWSVLLVYIDRHWGLNKIILILK